MSYLAQAMHKRYLAPIALFAWLLGSLVVSQALPALRAQTVDQAWGEPVNLSHTGAASQPVPVIGQGGMPQVFWWDRFDGLMTTRRQGNAWLDAQACPIPIPTDSEKSKGPSYVKAMPHITYDARGWAHAWWQANDANGSLGLWNSALRIGTTTWYTGTLVAESALTYDVVSDRRGNLYVAYIRQAHTDAEPAGVYYVTSADNGNTWSSPAMLYASVYFRLLTSDNARVRLAVDTLGRAMVVWEDPRLQKTFAARLDSDGAKIGLEELDVPWAPGHWDIAAVSDEMALLWTKEAAPACLAFSQHSFDGGASWTPPTSIELTGNSACDLPVAIASEIGKLTFVQGLGGNAIKLMAWNNGKWAISDSVGFSFDEPELQRSVALAALRLALAEGKPIIVATGSDGDIWCVASTLDVGALTAAAASPWSYPAAISEGQAPLSLPVLAADPQGNVHALWPSTGENGLGVLASNGWKGPLGEALRSSLGSAAAVATSPGKTIEHVTAVAVKDTLHVVWADGDTGELLYAQAEAAGARSPSSWSDVQPLPGPADVAQWPSLTADGYGTLHLAFAALVNEKRGIYYMQSQDGGRSWSTPSLVFDAAAAGWVSADEPTVAVDNAGNLHVAWVRGSLDRAQAALGIYYARSTDGGATWSEPMEVVEEGYERPLLAVVPPSQIHLVWQDSAATARCWHQWSDDQGQHWTMPREIGNTSGLYGPAAIASDKAGALHLVALTQGTDAGIALHHVTWDGRQWRSNEPLYLGWLDNVLPGVAMALDPELGQLSIAFRGSAGDAADEAPTVFVAQRAVPAVELVPLPTLTPLPTATKAPTPIPTPTLPSNLPTAPELPAGGLTDLPPTLVVGAVLAGIVAIGAIIVLPMLRRRR